MKRVRYRYIVFEIVGDRVDRRSVINRLNELWGEGVADDAEKLWLVYFRGNVGIARCMHTMKDRAIELINGLSSIEDKKVEVRSIGTSGTIKSAMSKFVK